MYNIDYFSFWKEPITRINRIGIYPLDEPGKTKYFSKDSYTHHYLRKTDPYVFKEITGKDIDAEIEENKAAMKRREEWEEKEKAKYFGGNCKTEACEEKVPEQENTLNQLKTEGNENAQEQSSTKKKENNRYKSMGKKPFKANNSLSRTGYYLANTTRNGGFGRRLGRSCGKFGFQTMNNNKTKCKLPPLGSGNNTLTVSVCGTCSSKEMGETYNPYAFISPSINRTKRNYVGGLFHC